MSLFGGSLAKPAGGLFGTSTASPFGQSTAQQTQQQQPAQPQPSLFSSPFGSSTAQQQQAQQQQQQLQQQQLLQQQMLQQQQAQAQQAESLSKSQFSSLWQQPDSIQSHQKPIPDQIGIIMRKWDPADPNCVFKHYFYNKVDAAHIPYYKPQPHEDPKEWEEALQNKPAPGFMPVLCAGFQTLAERLKVQSRAVGTYNAKLHEINSSLDAMLSRHDLETSIRSLAARRRHAELGRRCLALAAKVQVLRNRGYALSGDEDDLAQKLQKVEKEIQDPALSARMEELWSRLIVLRNYAEALKAEISKRGAQPVEGLGEEIEVKAKKILEDYEKQLSHLRKELELVKTDFDAWDKEHGPLPKKDQGSAPKK